MISNWPKNVFYSAVLFNPMSSRAQKSFNIKQWQIPRAKLIYFSRGIARVGRGYLPPTFDEKLGGGGCNLLK
jgi:hypothetical protein